VTFVRPHRTLSVERQLLALEQLAPTFGDIQTNGFDEVPFGYHRDHFEIDLGDGDEAFARSVQGLKTWRAHRMAFLRMLPEGAELLVGANVIVALGLSRFSIAAPCRVIEVIDSPERFAFTYATLPGHPEQGEETFAVVRAHNGAVQFEITATSRPRSFLARASGPVGRRVQQRTSRAYLAALRRYVRQRIE
jgi:uncharacterized protein (UPF0548 family)